MTIKSKAKMVRNPANPQQWIVSQGGQPGIIGPNNEDLLPVDVYSGCFARVSGIMFGTEYSGKRYISVRLNNVQKAWDGERFGGGGRPDAKSQFDASAAAPPPGAVGAPGCGAPGACRLNASRRRGRPYSGPQQGSTYYGRRDFQRRNRRHGKQYDVNCRQVSNGFALAGNVRYMVPGTSNVKVAQSHEAVAHDSDGAAGDMLASSLPPARSRNLGRPEGVYRTHLRL
jgi:hypothetical protein